MNFDPSRRTIREMTLPQRRALAMDAAERARRQVAWCDAGGFDNDAESDGAERIAGNRIAMARLLLDLSQPCASKTTTNREDPRS